MWSYFVRRLRVSAHVYLGQLRRLLLNLHHLFTVLVSDVGSGVKPYLTKIIPCLLRTSSVLNLLIQTTKNLRLLLPLYINVY